MKGVRAALACVMIGSAWPAAPSFAQVSVAPSAPLVQTESRFAWQPADDRLRRFTALDTTDGMIVTLLTDRGVVARVRLRRRQDGRITGAEPRSIHYLRDPDGVPLTGPWRNAQGLGLRDDGVMFVAFEGYGRVWAYDAPDAAAQALPPHRDFDRLSVGAGLSGVAVGQSGVVFAIPQRPARMTFGTPSYHFWDGAWEGSFRLPPDGQFHPVGADIGPDGRLYVLERETGAAGHRIQVRRFVLQGSRIDGGTLVMRGDPGQFGALSGLSVWRGREGKIRLLMVEYATEPAPVSNIVEILLPG
ncbi:MAG: hypothetical protein HLUCCA12_11290 [Rhodobacteraceae bacterium HLUCCA12]|nr:MAG: hypothetical protein HLUCCA12_11290 [Rhodobacteraceae bacterium HLUCCA12]